MSKPITRASLGLLRTRRHRPRRRRAADKRDELAPSHCLPKCLGQKIVQRQTSRLKGETATKADVRFGS